MNLYTFRFKRCKSAPYRQKPQEPPRAAALDFKSSSDDMRVRTDENREVFVFEGFAAREPEGYKAKPVISKKWRGRFFDMRKRCKNALIPT
jgi:hypothetical protein